MAFGSTCQSRHSFVPAIPALPDSDSIAVAARDARYSSVRIAASNERNRKHAHGRTRDIAKGRRSPPAESCRWSSSPLPGVCKGSRNTPGRVQKKEPVPNGRAKGSQLGSPCRPGTGATLLLQKI